MSFIAIHEKLLGRKKPTKQRQEAAARKNREKSTTPAPTHTHTPNKQTTKHFPVPVLRDARLCPIWQIKLRPAGCCSAMPWLLQVLLLLFSFKKDFVMQPRSRIEVFFLMLNFEKMGIFQKQRRYYSVTIFSVCCQTIAKILKSFVSKLFATFGI